MESVEVGMALPLILHIPHASSVIPADLRETLLLDDDALSRELLAMTDWHTDRLFAFPGTEAVVHPVSRLICDPERFVDDAREPMAAFGMGVVYTRTHRFGILRQPPTESEREALLNRFYRPHHARLEEAFRGMRITAIRKFLYARPVSGLLMGGIMWFNLNAMAGAR